MVLALKLNRLHAGRAGPLHCDVPGRSLGKTATDGRLDVASVESRWNPRRACELWRESSDPSTALLSCHGPPFRILCSCNVATAQTPREPEVSMTA
jgi:hypothetical protein